MKHFLIVVSIFLFFFCFSLTSQAYELTYQDIEEIVKTEYESNELYSQSKYYYVFFGNVISKDYDLHSSNDTARISETSTINISVCYTDEPLVITRNSSDFSYSGSCNVSYSLSLSNYKRNWDNYLEQSQLYTFSNYKENVEDLKGTFYYYATNYKVAEKQNETGGISLEELKPYFVLISLCSILVFLAIMWKRT